MSGPAGPNQPTICSTSRFPAGGTGQNSIWSHEAANQAQNNDFDRPQFWPSSLNAMSLKAISVQAISMKVVCGRTLTTSAFGLLRVDALGT